MMTRIGVFTVLCMGGLVVAPGLSGRAMGETSPQTAYTYQEVDHAAEQRKYVERLKQDKVKVDFAIGNTRTLIERSKQRPYLPELYLRLAELYVEKSRIVFFVRKAEMPKGAKNLNSLESNTLKQQAIEVYHRIDGDFPDFPYLDKVHFFLAHEYRELGNIESMVREYATIVRRFSTSPYAPEAHLLLGDHFFHSQDLELAKKHYGAVLTYEDSPAVGVARYKLAWCHINDADYGAAIHLFEEAVSAAPPAEDVELDSYRKVDVRLESLIDMAYCYVEQYKDRSPEEAIAYFERYAWSRPVLTTSLEKLAYRFFIKKKWQHAAAVYRKVSTLRNDPETLLEVAARVFECVRAIGSFDHADRDLELIVKALEKQRYASHIPDDAKTEKAAEYELYARDIVTHLHQKALKKKALEDYRVAAAAYEAYLDFFEESESYAEMQRNYAETLFSAQDYLKAGRQYEALATAGLQTEKDREQTLYGAVLSYHHALKNKDRLDAFGRVYAKAGLRSAGSSYVVEFSESDNVPNVVFNMAWVVFDEGDYETAITEFSRFVQEYPNTREARAAVHLILDAHRQREDYEGLIAYGQQVLAGTVLDGESRAEVADIVKAAESKVIYPLTLAAVDDWEGGKQGLLAFARDNGGSNLGEQALQALVASSAELVDLPTLFQVGQQMLDEYPDSARVEETLNVLIDTCIKAGQFRQLVGYLELFAYRLPEHRSGAAFLRKAAEIREQLGQYREANQDLTLLADRGGEKTRDSALVLRTAENALLAGDWTFARQTLAGYSHRLEGGALLRGQALQGRIARQDGDAVRFGQALGTARKLYDASATVLDAAARDAIAEIEYENLETTYRSYLQFQLGPSLDPKRVSEKSELLAALLEGYHKVMRFQSPQWALAACYRAYQVNGEFSRFLREAPLPELDLDQEAQYRGLVGQKADGYDKRARDYLEKCWSLAAKWEICDPELVQYFAASGSEAAPGTYSPVSGLRELRDEWLLNPALLERHVEAVQHPDDPAALNRLAAAYVAAGDHHHAILIAMKGLEVVGEDDRATRAVLLNTLGVARLYCNQDPDAKAAFAEALEADAGQMAARVNLAGLYSHYRHADKAQGIYNAIAGEDLLGDDEQLIHPRSRELYYEVSQYAQK